MNFVISLKLDALFIFGDELVSGKYTFDFIIKIQG